MRKNKRPWSVAELARAAAVDGSYLRQLLLAGRLDGYKIGNSWAIPREAGDAWLVGRQAKQEKP